MKMVWARELLAKEKKGLFLGQDIFLTDFLIGADQKIPNCLITITFLEEAKTAIRSGIKSRFGILGFSKSDATLGPGFLFDDFVN